MSPSLKSSRASSADRFFPVFLALLGFVVPALGYPSRAQADGAKFSRAVLAVQSGGTAVAAPGPVSGGKEIGYSYNGQYADVVRHLLDGAPDWKTPGSLSDPNDPNLQPPRFSPNQVAQFGQRDKYVMAAILMAYSAEGHARLGKPDDAANAATAMMQNLKMAHSLESDAPPVLVNGAPLVTAYITDDYLNSLTYPN